MARRADDGVQDVSWLASWEQRWRWSPQDVAAGGRQLAHESNAHGRGVISRTGVGCVERRASASVTRLHASDDCGAGGAFSTGTDAFTEDLDTMPDVGRPATRVESPTQDQLRVAICGASGMARATRCTALTIVCANTPCS